MARRQIKLFNLPISVLREGDCFVVYTPALDLSTSGKSYKEAKKRFGEAVQIFFEEIIKRGTLDKVLRDFGWRKIRREWRSPEIISQEEQKVEVGVSV